MSKTKEEGLVSVSIHAGELVDTGRGNDDTHQLRMGYTNFIHITPETATQWLAVLTPIAQEASE